MDQYIGKMLDNRYEILELIGSGGMANVYKAKCHRLNRLVAIKILKEEFAKDPDIRKNWRTTRSSAAASATSRAPLPSSPMRTSSRSMTSPPRVTRSISSWS